jgi:NhaA family Na+:H+ antiporter
MSLFIGSLAFSSAETMNTVRLGVICGSVFSGLAGYAALRTARNGRTNGADGAMRHAAGTHSA